MQGPEGDPPKLHPLFDIKQIWNSVTTLHWCNQVVFTFGLELVYLEQRLWQLSIHKREKEFYLVMQKFL